MQPTHHPLSGDLTPVLLKIVYGNVMPEACRTLSPRPEREAQRTSLGQDPVALCSCGGGLWQANVLKERDDVLLPEDALVLLLQVDEVLEALECQM